LEHRASNPVSVKNLTAIETSTIVKLLRPYVPVGGGGGGGGGGGEEEEEEEEEEEVHHCKLYDPSAIYLNATRFLATKTLDIQHDSN
jgi:hypothetical protein